MCQITYDASLIRSMLEQLQEDIDDVTTWSALHDYLTDHSLYPEWIRYSHGQDTRVIDLVEGCKAIASRQGKVELKMFNSTLSTVSQGTTTARWELL